jgi:hypothetical protein
MGPAGRVALALIVGSIGVVDGLITRRQVCARLGGVVAFSALQPAYAASKSYTKEEASAAMQRIRLTRAALDDVSKAIASQSFGDAQALLEGPLITGFEKDCTILVQSKGITSEDKVAIGTIRRFGVGADVIIMIGGLTNAVSEKDAKGAEDFAVKAKAALDEIMVIVRHNKL